MYMVSRREVTRAALRLLSIRGYATTSMRDLAGHLGIQAPTLYSHYRSKEELLVAALDPLLADLDLLLDEPEPSAADLPEWLRRYQTCLLNHREAAKLAAGDLAVDAVPALGRRLRQQNALARVNESRRQRGPTRQRPQRSSVPSGGRWCASPLTTRSTPTAPSTSHC